MSFIALTIAGSDPSGGAGIQADLKTFHQFKVYGQAVITLLTVQNTESVKQVRHVDPDLVAAQLDTVLEDIVPHSAKTGALGSESIIEVIAARKLPKLVIDPVMISKHGSALMDPDAQKALIGQLFSQALLVTPNLPETTVICGKECSPQEAAQRIRDLGAANVLIKGGHQQGDASDDLLLLSDGKFVELLSPRIHTEHTHGTGCTYSAAITALLARDHSLESAVQTAKKWITEAIKTNPGIGRGSGPVNHFAPVPLEQR